MIKLKRYFIVSAILLILVGNSFNVFAESINYTIDSKGKQVPTPACYTVTNTFRYLGQETGFLNAPTDIFIDNNDFLYIADTGNNRIIKLNENGDVISVFTGPDELPFNGPQGVYVDKDGSIFVADSNNNRIVQLSSSGKYITEYRKPKSPLITDSFAYNPTKIYINDIGYIYSIRYQSLMMMDAYNNFQGYVGAAPVGFDLINLLVRMFATREQRLKLVIKQPPPITNFVIGRDGMIYATSLDKGSMIKKINSVGTNIYPSGSYGEPIISDLTQTQPILADIAVDGHGIVTVIQQNNQMIYQYDQDGKLLGAFGGKGEGRGFFSDPVSVAVDSKNHLYVLDKDLKRIQKFKPTKYTDLIHGAVKDYSDGKYSDSYDKWLKVIQINANYEYSHSGIGNYLIKQEKYKEAINEFRIANDKSGYSDAFSKYRHEILRANFGWFVLIILAIGIAVVLFVIKIKKKAGQIIVGVQHLGAEDVRITPARLFLMVLFHPIESATALKRDRESLKFYYGFFYIAAAIAVRILYIFIAGYTLTDVTLQDANMLFEGAKFVVIVLTWTIASFAVSSIMNGETKLKETFVATAASLSPYILLTIPFGILSRVLCGLEAGFYQSILIVMWAWIILMLFINVMVMNDFSFVKTIGVCMIGIFVMFLIWAVIMLVFALSDQLVKFFSGIFKELAYKFFY